MYIQLTRILVVVMFFSLAFTAYPNKHMPFYGEEKKGIQEELVNDLFFSLFSIRKVLERLTVPIVIGILVFTAVFTLFLRSLILFLIVLGVVLTTMFNNVERADCLLKEGFRFLKFKTVKNYKKDKS